MLLGNILLALAWAALQGEFSLATLVTGHVLGYLILLALVRGRRTWHVTVHRPGPPRDRPGDVLLWELLRANLRIALDVATPRYHMKPGIIAVPLDVTRDSEILLLSMLTDATRSVVALDLIGVLMVCILVATAATTAQQAFLDVAMVVALISFVGTVAYSRYIERDRS